MSDAVPVAFVSSHATLGGAEAYLGRILDGLGEEWIAGVASLQDGPLVARLRARGCVVEVVNTGASPLALLGGALGLRRWLGGRPGRLVHANGVKAALVAGLATLGTGRRVVWMRHDLAGGRLVTAVAGARAATIVCVSETVARSLGRWGRTRARVIHDGVPPAEPATTLARTETVLLLGRFCPAKGQLDLVEAAPAILAARPAARFVLAGPDDAAFPGHRAAVVARVRELGLGDAVAVHDHVEDPLALVRDTAVLAAPSRVDPVHGWAEGFGLAAAEAMSVGVPVVASTNGSLPEIVGDAGVLVAEGDRDALAAALADLLADPARRAELGARGRRRVEERFRLEDALARLADCYREVAA